MEPDISQFLGVSDQILSILDVENKERRDRMIADVFIFLVSTALAKVSGQYLSSTGRQKLVEVMRADLKKVDQAAFERRWADIFQIIDEEVAPSGSLQKGVSETIQQTLAEAFADYIKAITKNATEEQKQRIAELIKRQAQVAK